MVEWVSGPASIVVGEVKNKVCSQLNLPTTLLVQILHFSDNGLTHNDMIIFWFWLLLLQTSTGMFGLGNSQTKCTKSYSTSPVAEMSRLNPMRLAKLVWISNRTVALMLADGSETKFNV